MYHKVVGLGKNPNPTTLLFFEKKEKLSLIFHCETASFHLGLMLFLNLVKVMFLKFYSVVFIFLFQRFLQEGCFLLLHVV